MFAHFGSSEYIFACFGMVPATDSSLTCLCVAKAYVVLRELRWLQYTKKDNTKLEFEDKVAGMYFGAEGPVIRDEWYL